MNSSHSPSVDPNQPLLIGYTDAVRIIDTLRESLAEPELFADRHADEERAFYAQMADEAHTVERLATALAVHADAWQRREPPADPRRASPGASRTAQEARERIIAIMADANVPDAQFTLTGEELYRFVSCLHDAVARWTFPGYDEVSREAADAFARLRDLAYALSVAAIEQCAYIGRRLNDRAALTPERRG